MPTKTRRWTTLNLLRICIRGQAGLRGHRLRLPALDQDGSGSLGSPWPCQGAKSFAPLRFVFPPNKLSNPMGFFVQEVFSMTSPLY